MKKKIILSHNVNLNAELQKIETDKQSRNYQIGLSLGRVRYNYIKHGNSYLSFEDSVLTASMNGTDTGDINNASLLKISQ